MAKQTSKNNADLRAVKALMNRAIYKQFAATYNGEGKDRAVFYLSQHFHAETLDRTLAELGLAGPVGSSPPEEPAPATVEASRWTVYDLPVRAQMLLCEIGQQHDSHGEPTVPVPFDRVVFNPVRKESWGDLVDDCLVHSWRSPPLPGAEPVTMCCLTNKGILAYKEATRPQEPTPALVPGPDLWNARGGDGSAL